MKILPSFKLLAVCALLLLGSFSSSGQNLYFQPVYSDATEVRIINESSKGIRSNIPNGENPALGTLDYLTFAQLDGEDPTVFFSEGPGFNTATSQTQSIYPTLLLMMYDLEDEGHTLVTLDDLLGNVDRLWWSVEFFELDAEEYAGPLTSVGFEDLSYTDGSGIHIVYRFYDLE